MEQITDNPREEDTQKDRYLIFALGQESYGIEIQYVTEIIGLQGITQVPELPNYIRGVTNLRGNIIPLMDVRLRFKKDPLEYNDRTCVIIIDINDINIGLIVDRVSEVITILEVDIVEPPNINHTLNHRFIKRIGKVGDDVKLLLDCEKLLNEDDLHTINEVI